MKIGTARALHNLAMDALWGLSGYNIHSWDYTESPKFPKCVLDGEQYITMRDNPPTREGGRNRGGMEAENFRRAMQQDATGKALAAYENEGEHRRLLKSAPKPGRNLGPKYRSIADEIRESAADWFHKAPAPPVITPEPKPDIGKLIAPPYEEPPRPTEKSLTICRADISTDLPFVMDECVRRYADNFGAYPTYIHLSISNYENFLKIVRETAAQCGDWSGSKGILRFRGKQVYADSRVRDTEVLASE